MATNEARQESITILHDIFDSMGMKRLTEQELRDWHISGGETYAQLQEWANDYANDLHTERCEEKNAWRYEK